MRSLSAVVLFTILSGITHVAAGQSGWASTFSSPGLSAHVEPDLRFMVLPAGPSGSADAAAKALGRALEQAGAALVMDEGALGTLSGLDDAAILDKAQSFPIDLVVIVRVFGGAQSGDDTLVAVAYRKDSKVAFALNGREGTPLAPPKTEGDGRASQGVSAAAVSSVAAITKHQASDHDERVRRYKEEFLQVGDVLLASGSGVTIVDSRSKPYQGQYRKPLKWAEFFEVAERKDLADEYRRRRRSKWIMAGAGVVGFGVGVPMFSIALINRGYCFDDEPDCDDSLALAPFITGLVMATGGFAVALAAMFRSKQPVEMSEARRIADEHNKKLRLELGLDEELQSTTQELRGGSSSPRFWQSLSLGPSADRHGGGFQLRFQL